MDVTDKLPPWMLKEKVVHIHSSKTYLRGFIISNCFPMDPWGRNNSDIGLIALHTQKIFN